MKKHNAELDVRTMSEKAYDYYSGSDWEVWKDGEGGFWYGLGREKHGPFTLEELEEYLEGLAEDSYPSLWEETHHEAGIIVFDSGEVMVCNWGQCEGGVLPIMGPFGLGPFPWPAEKYNFGKMEREFTTDIRQFLPGTVWKSEEEGTYETDMDVLCDEFNDLIALFFDGVGTYGPTTDPESLEGYVYTLPGVCKIIAPDMWN